MAHDDEDNDDSKTEDDKDDEITTKKQHKLLIYNSICTNWKQIYFTIVLNKLEKMLTETVSTKQ